MRISHYSFGRIVVDGVTYNSDVIIYPGRVDSDWWRGEGHLLVLEDLKQVLESPCGILVIGTGHDEMMKVAPGLKKDLEKRGIEVRVVSTPAAVKIFNDLSSSGAAVAALHLTC